MSKLRPYLADIASAIREKKGSSEPINAKDFSNEIRSIQSGGGEVVEVEEKDVSFWDYDGTLLYSYTIEEAKALPELPTPPNHEGLVFDGWNWEYEDVKNNDIPMDIGALYVTDDGKTRLYLEVEDEDGVDIELTYRQTANDVAVDFGDGSDVQSSADANAVIPHHYAKGNYVLVMWSKGNLNNVELLNNNNKNNNAFGVMNKKTCSILKKVETGQGVRYSNQAFMRCFNLRTISSPKQELNPWGSAFAYCTSLIHFNAYNGYLYSNSLFSTSQLKRITFGKNIRLSDGALSYSGLQKIKLKQVASWGTSFECCNITQIVIPHAFHALVDKQFKFCVQLEKVVINSEMTAIPTGCFEECRALRDVYIPSSVTEIKAHAFHRCENLFELVFPPNLTTIGANAFFYCGAMKFDFSACQQIPTLGNTGAFQYIPSESKIIVPDALYDAWKASTNWSTYADRIVKASEYNG